MTMLPPADTLALRAALRQDGLALVDSTSAPAADMVGVFSGTAYENCTQQVEQPVCADRDQRSSNRNKCLSGHCSCLHRRRPAARTLSPSGSHRLMAATLWGNTAADLISAMDANGSMQSGGGSQWRHQRPTACRQRVSLHAPPIPSLDHPASAHKRPYSAPAPEVVRRSHTELCLFGNSPANNSFAHLLT
jgi:hypothetical protein